MLIDMLQLIPHLYGGRPLPFFSLPRQTPGHLFSEIQRRMLKELHSQTLKKETPPEVFFWFSKHNVVNTSRSRGSILFFSPPKAV